MTRIPTVDPKQATGKAKALLDTVQQSLGRVPNLMRTLANAPAALDSYLQFTSALAGGSLDAKVREQIALAVAEANLCNYCLAAHSAIGGMVGLLPAEVESARRATADAAKTDALLKLARSIVVNRGEIPDDDLQAARRRRRRRDRRGRRQRRAQRADELHEPRRADGGGLPEGRARGCDCRREQGEVMP